MKLDYKKNLKKQTLIRIKLILVKLLIIIIIRSKNIFDVIIVYMILVKTRATKSEILIFIVYIL